MIKRNRQDGLNDMGCQLSNIIKCLQSKKKYAKFAVKNAQQNKHFVLIIAIRPEK